MIQYNYIYYLLILIAFSCNKKENSKQENLKEIKINLSEINEDQEFFNDYFRLKKHIKLETSNSSLLSYLSSVIVLEDRIFISDTGKDAFIFDDLGHFVKELPRGRGPSEYSMCQDIYYHKEESELYVYDMVLKKTLIYDKNGEFKRTIEIPVPMNNFFVLNSKLITVFTSFMTNDNTKNDENSFNQLFVLEQVNDEWKIKSEALPFSKNRRNRLSYWSPTTRFFDTDQGLLFIPPFDTSVYKYDSKNKKFSKKINFDYGKNEIPVDFIDNQKNSFFKELKKEGYIHGWENFYIDNGLFCFTTGVSDELTIIYDEKNKRITKQKQLIDIENSIPLHVFPNEADSNMLLMIAYPSEILALENKKEGSLGMKLSKEINELDNPILLIYEKK